LSQFDVMHILGFNNALKFNAVQTYHINQLYRLLLNNRDIGICPKDIQTQFLVTVLIVATIYVVSISISAGVSSASNEQLEYNITTGKINSTLKNEEENKFSRAIKFEFVGTRAVIGSKIGFCE